MTINLWIPVFHGFNLSNYFIYTYLNITVKKIIYFILDFYLCLAKYLALQNETKWEKLKL